MRRAVHLARVPRLEHGGRRLSHGMVTAEPVLSTTMVLGLAAATR